MATHDTACRASAGSTPKAKLLLVDDDPLIVESLGLVLDDEYEIHSAATRAEAKSLLSSVCPVPALALVDLGLPPTPHGPEEGFTLIGELLAFDPGMKILVLSGQSSRATIQHAMTLGAVDFIPKPTDALVLKARLAHQSAMVAAERRARASSEGANLLGTSLAIETLRALIRQFANVPFPVLVVGESGVGKELVAHRLHTEGQRARQPFLAVNCAAFTPELLETQLFGHDRGAFTGAAGARAGILEEVGRGSLFLDEVGELPALLQSKLLRVLENGEYYRLGETHKRRAECRVITATNRDLADCVRRGAFRQDLYHRLSVLSIEVPPLRERGDDILLLLQTFRALYASSTATFELEPAAEARLCAYEFPGNVRELRNIVIRLSAKYPGRSVGIAQIEAELESEVFAPIDTEALSSDQVAERQIKTPGFRLDETLAAWERRYIDAALKLGHGNLSQAARLLGVNRTTLYSKIERLADSRG
ncbi:MAG: sigma-54-dependent transcriptional regulator [Gammaproteobacteria bacterium]